MINTSDRLRLAFTGFCEYRLAVFQALGSAGWFWAPALHLACIHSSSTGWGPGVPCQIPGWAEEHQRRGGPGPTSPEAQSSRVDRLVNLYLGRAWLLLGRMDRPSAGGACREYSSFCLKVWKMPQRRTVAHQLQKKGKGTPGRSTVEDVTAGRHEAEKGASGSNLFCGPGVFKFFFSHKTLASKKSKAEAPFIKWIKSSFS